MSASTHRIRRQRWAIKIGSEADALLARKEMREKWEIAAQPAFEAAFDEVAPGPEIVRFRRLEVSVKVRDIDALVHVLQERVRQELRRLVDAATERAAHAPPTHEPVAAEDHRRDGVPGDGVLAHYVRAGNVPWHAMERDHAPAIRALEHEARDALEGALAALREMTDEATLAAGLFRLVQLLPEEQWLSVAERILGAPMHPRGVELLDDVVRSKGSSIPRHDRIRLVANLIAALAATAPRGQAGDDDTGALQVIRGVVASWMRQRGFHTPVSMPAFLERWQPLGEPDAGPHDRRQPGAVSSATTPDTRRTATTRPATVNVPAYSRETHGDQFPSTVASAGLVLLHPYLSQLFKTVGLVLSGGMPADSPAVARAAALLHLLASGRDEPYELELGFVKVLLGFTPETALPVAGGLLTDADRDEAQALLEAVVGHWGALKHTSVAALRASFLQRTGLLAKDENGWRLRVETGPFDVLLDRLPWGIATVKLPWMSRPIYCEWPTA